MHLHPKSWDYNYEYITISSFAIFLSLKLLKKKSNHNPLTKLNMMPTTLRRILYREQECFHPDRQEVTGALTDKSCLTWDAELKRTLSTFWVKSTCRNGIFKKIYFLENIFPNIMCKFNFIFKWFSYISYFLIVRQFSSLMTL